MSDLWNYKNTELKHWRILWTCQRTWGQFSLTFLYFKEQLKMLINF